MFFTKLVVILYKNLLLRRTQWLITGLEVLFPILFVYLAILLSSLTSPCNSGKASIEDIGEFSFKSSSNWCNGNAEVAYAPGTNETIDAIGRLNQNCNGLMKLKQYPNERELVERLAKGSKKNRIGIVFPDGLKPLQNEIGTGTVKDSVISYKIRMNPDISKIPSTAKVLPIRKLGDYNYSQIGPNYYHGYNYMETSKFLYLQRALEKVLVEMITGKTFSINIHLEGFANYIFPGVDITEEPWKRYADGTPAGLPREPLKHRILSVSSGASIIPGFLSFAVLFMVPTITRNVVSEKQTGVAELLKSAGVSGLIQWLGWMINSLVPMLFSLSICTLLIFNKVSVDQKGCNPRATLEYSDWTLMWFIFLLYILSTIALCFFICSLIKRPTIATTIAVIICVFSSVILSLPLNKIGFSVFPNCAMSFAFKAFLDYDTTVLDDTEQPYGARWDWELLNYHPPREKGFFEVAPVSLMKIIGMMIADILVYSLLALYFENVLPSEHGVRRPWYWFNFHEMYEKRRKRLGYQTHQTSGVEGNTAPANNQVAPAPAKEDSSGQASETSMIIQGKAKESNNNMDVSFEAEGYRNTPVGIEVQNIFKKFGRKHAVVGVNLKMYQGDVFALLGHNGAGKTTLISMITGFFSPTSGTAIVDGHDIKLNMTKARKRMGLCPQHNMLFENISVTNQLIIFGMLRGLTCKEAKNEGQGLLLKMNLFDKKSTLAKKLSGGQKRKLSLAMALIGGTKVVLLDEPTSGMDPQARREIWDLLLELREGRTVLLTTHFMEEADVLGDRIAIMAAGRVQCCGTTAFLKKYYGTGFTLTLTLREQGPSDTSSAHTNANLNIGEGLNTSKKPSVAKILALVQKSIPNASIKKDARSDANSSEVFLTLPSGTATTAALTIMFTDLTANKSGLGIQTIGLQQTTMDEVFLRVGELADEESGTTHKYEWTENDFIKAPKLSGGKKICMQFLALLRKKGLRSSRNWCSLLCEVIVTLVLALAIIGIFQGAAKLVREVYKRSSQQVRQGTSAQQDPQQPELPISLNSYESPISFYYSDDPTMTPHIEKVLGSSSMKFTPNPKGPPFKVALALEGKSDMSKFKRKMIIAVASSSSSSITAMFNAHPYHAAPLALNIATNIALRAMQPLGNNKIQVSNHPWTPLKGKSKRSVSLSSRFFNPSDPQSRAGPYMSEFCEPDAFYSLSPYIIYPSAMLLALAFILFTSLFIVGPIEEKICNVKQLELMTGLRPAVFWASHFVYDYALYFIMVVLILLLIGVIELIWYPALSVAHGAGVLFLILMCYGFSSISLAYLLSLRSSSVAGGYSLVLLIHLTFGIIFYAPLQSSANIGDKDIPFFLYLFVLLFRFISYCFPDPALLAAITKYMGIASINMVCDYKNLFVGSGFAQKYVPYLKWSTANPDYGESVTESGVLQELFYLVLVGIFYVALLMMLEYKLCQKIFRANRPPPFPPNIYDDDVYQEAERLNMLVQSDEVGTECMVIQNLSKAFGDFSAVAQVSFGVHYGECFGLLGVNGAGKTTLFKMITGEITPSGGNIFGFGTTTVQSPTFFFSNIGYCPQFDAIFVKFTGKEMLELFGVLRGLSFSSATTEAAKWLLRFGLSDSANVRCGNYSGGMKRRLSTAMAMIGDPALLLLDEPTSGVDPVSRHQFWGILRKIRDSGQSIILTSHSMDECEALCSRLGIMVNGQFQCFGGVQHLTTKFAQGYSLTIKLKPDLPFGTTEFEEMKMSKFEQAIAKRFQPCALKDKHQNLIQYHLQDSSLSWDVLFKTLESFKKEFEDMIEDYSVNQTSLEEVFLAFARLQYDERKVEVNMCRKICTCSC